MEYIAEIGVVNHIHRFSSETDVEAIQAIDNIASDEYELDIEAVLYLAEVKEYGHRVLIDNYGD